MIRQENLQIATSGHRDMLDLTREVAESVARAAIAAGNIGLDNAAVMQALVTVGYDDWIFIEQDTHLQDPLLDLTISRNFLRTAGF